MSECADQQKASNNNQTADVSAFCHTDTVGTLIYEKELQNINYYKTINRSINALNRYKYKLTLSCPECISKHFK